MDLFLFKTTGQLQDIFFILQDTFFKVQRSCLQNLLQM